MTSAMPTAPYATTVLVDDNNDVGNKDNDDDDDDKEEDEDGNDGNVDNQVTYKSSFDVQTYSFIICEHHFDLLVWVNC